MIVEFTGLPGSGKTTACINLEKHYKNKNKIKNITHNINKKQKIIRILYKNIWIIKLVLIHPVFGSKLLKLVINSKQKTLKDFLSVLLNIFFIASIYKTYNRKSSNKVILLDQGGFQIIISLLFKARNPEIVLKSDITKYLLKSDYLINIKISPEEAERRLKNRKGKQSRIEKADKTDITHSLKYFNNIIEKLLNLQDLDSEIITIKGDNITAQEVSDQLVEYSMNNKKNQ